MKVAGTLLLLLVAVDPGISGAATVASCRYEQLPTTQAAAVSSAIGDHTLAIYYVVPTDIAFNPAVLRRLKLAAAEVQAWYQCATGGYTWEFAHPDTVAVYMGQHDRQYYNVDWWGRLFTEMGGAGYPIWGDKTITTLWAHGSGWWAGAAQGCLGECGNAILGVELLPEFNNPAYSGGDCPGGSGVGAWPCTPLGAWVHELGHTLGLPHPADVPATSADAGHSVMQTHWNYPDYASGGEDPWGFLTLERQTLIANPFMKWGLSIKQSFAGCDVVNLPNTGSEPVASFTSGPSYLNKFVGTVTSTGATSHYWTFGDGGIGHSGNSTHNFTAPGTYRITLRSTSANAMADTMSTQMAVSVSGVPVSPETRAPSCTIGPNPFVTTATIRFSSAGTGPSKISIFDVSGRLIRSFPNTRASGSLEWDGRDDRGHDAPAGIYFVRVTTAQATVGAPVARLRLR